MMETTCFHHAWIKAQLHLWASLHGMGSLEQHCLRMHNRRLMNARCECREGRAWVSPSGISSGCEGHAPLLERMQRTCIARLAAASEVLLACLCCLPGISCDLKL